MSSMYWLSVRWRCFSRSLWLCRRMALFVRAVHHQKTGGLTKKGTPATTTYVLSLWLRCWPVRLAFAMLKMVLGCRGTASGTGLVLELVLASALFVVYVGFSDESHPKHSELVPYPWLVMDDRLEPAAEVDGSSSKPAPGGNCACACAWTWLMPVTWAAAGWVRLVDDDDVDDDPHRTGCCCCCCWP